MPINLGTNFDYRGQQFDFERQSVTSVAELAAMPADSLPNGYEVYCKETDKYYQFSNKQHNETYGYFTERMTISKDGVILAYPQFRLDPRTGHLYVIKPDENWSSQFFINNGHLYLRNG